MVKIGKITLGVCQTNCYFIYNEGSSDIVIIDPADAGEYLYTALRDKGFNISAILLTHGHFDHIYGVKELKKLAGVLVYAGKDEEKLLESGKLNCSLSFGREETVTPDYLFKDGEEITLADIKIKVLFTPGHTEGSVCYYVEDGALLISGDTLFFESVGRTDLPTGSMGTLVRSIKDKLLMLPDNVRVYPGHGGTTTIGNERDNNPFLG